MIPELGHFALIVALLLALTQAILPLYGAQRGRLARVVGLQLFGDVHQHRPRARAGMLHFLVAPEDEALDRLEDR